MNVKTFFCSAFLMCSSFAFGHVGLDSPKGGETYMSGDEMFIEWHVVIDHNSLNWDLFYSLDDGVTWMPIVTNLNISQLNYNWTIPNVGDAFMKVKVVQVNPDYNYQAVSGELIIGAITSVDVTGTQGFKVRVYPQPTNSEFNLSLEDSKIGYYQLKVFTLSGRLEKSWKFNDPTEVFKLQSPPGLYIYQLIEGHSLIGVGKLVIE